MREMKLFIKVVFIMFVFAFSASVLLKADEVLTNSDQNPTGETIAETWKGLREDAINRATAREENGELINLSTNEVEVYEDQVNETTNEVLNEESL